MKLWIAITWIGSIALPLLAAAPAEYEALKANAEKLYADGSFAKAHEAYASATLTNLPATEQRWVRFRVADTQWRSQAATDTSDTTKLDAAQRELELLIRDVTRDEDHDRIWADVQESLGDFFWTRRNQNDWGSAWPHYQPALDWWAGAPDIELARARYLAIVWRIARPPNVVQPYYSYGYWGNYVPLDVLDNTLKIVQGDTDKAHVHYLIAMTIRNTSGSWEQRARVPEEFEGAIRIGKSTPWYDDALFNYAVWMNGQGKIVQLANGGWSTEPDYAKALELFRRFVREFSKGETRYYDSAQQEINNITQPQLSVSVPNLFLPDSEIQYLLNWRNLKRIDLVLYPVDLNRDVKLDETRQAWLQSINLATREKLKSWSYDPSTAKTDEQRSARPIAEDYKPGNGTLRLDGKLKPGAYMIEVRGGDKSARDLILVSDAALVLKSSGKQALVYFCNVLDGSPIAGGTVKLWEQWWENNTWHAREQTKETGEDGIAVFSLETHPQQSEQLFASAVHEDRQAFTQGGSYWGSNNSRGWRVYAFTDRPAYRPKETVQWKFIVRRYNDSVYSTPSDQLVEYEITDPRGAKVKSDKIALNSFGSASGSLELTEQMPLGEYHIEFWDSGRRTGIGGSTLFRLEEYKLPEFKVTVQTPEEEGPGNVKRRKTFRLGETVEATIQADYYFGGPVGNASVEVVVHQSPYWHYWQAPRPYPWFYEDFNSGTYGRWRSYGDQILKREVIKTDATGKATVKFETSANNGQDLEYRIEARVTDSSRREITGNGTVRVTRQRYYVDVHAEHNLYRPQDKVAVNFKALDPNEQPVQVEGSVKVIRDYWFEIWLAPDGREVKGDELKRLQSANKIWPPPPERPDQKNWRLKFRGYEHDDILTRTLKTDTNGVAELAFTPEREGYYRVTWNSDDTNSNSKLQVPSSKIQAETTVWVADNRTTDLGYRHGGVEIIVDKDTFRAGQRAPVMLVANAPDRYVLFTVEGDDLYSYELVHLEGTVKLVELGIQEQHVPNIFLSAALVSDRQIFVDTKQVVVPPVKNFLTVDVRPDREQYQPRDEGTLTVTTKDDNGKPVSAEVALGLVDESVYYIQADYAGDPRQFYFGTKRYQVVQMQSTFNQKNYVRLVEGENEELMDEKDRRLSRDRSDIMDDSIAMPGGAAGYMEQRLVNGLNINGPTGGGERRASINSTKVHSAAESPAPASVSGNLGLLADAAAKSGEPPGENAPAVVVRSDFRSTVFWQPDLTTDKDGKAVVKVKYPDSTTSWKATARATTTGNQFGIAETNSRTKQPLIVRLQAPRFFVAGDTVTISAVLNNNTDQAMDVRVALDVTAPASGFALKDSKEIVQRVPANGEARADWVAEVKSPGEVKLKVTGRGGKFGDAMERTYISYEHGIEKFIAKSGKARGDNVTIQLDLPSERKPGSTSLTVQVTPSMAVTMLDALPYLIDYPYGCTEQTMSRFLPAAITAKTLRDLGVEPADVMGRVFGGIETNTAVATHPKGKKDLAELDQIISASLERLYDFHRGDGGWGWWKQGDSDHWMTAYVVWGLSLARDAGIKINDGILSSGKNYLEKELVEEEENPDMQAFMLHAITASQTQTRANKFQETAFTNLWNKRDQLNAYTRALLALSAHRLGKSAEAKTLIANLENGVKRDDHPDTSVLINGKPATANGQPTTTIGTAHWGEDGVYWRWSEGGVESTAFVLRALLAIDPTNALVEPVSNWLIKNRRGAQWNSTRDTAIVVLAMNDYLRATRELKADADYELIVNGKSVARKKLSGSEVLSAPSRFAIDPQLIRERNEIQIKSSGRTSALYFAVEAKFFSTEEPVAPAGNEIFVKRAYYKLVGRPTLLKGYVYDREPLDDGESVTSGERVQALLTIETKNDYEYLMFEDLKPAGLEAVEIRSGESLNTRELKSGAVDRKFSSSTSSGEHLVQSGETLSGIAKANRTSVRAITVANHLTSDRILAGQRLILPPPVRIDDEDYTGRERWVYQELRDRKVALFIDKLPEGVWEIRYDLRAEVPGKFHALPVTGQAMYVPEIHCNGSETRIQVVDQKP